MTGLTDRPAAALEAVLDQIGAVAVAVSGGVDSMTLAVIAGRRLGPGTDMLHAVSPAVPPEASARVRAYAARERWRLEARAVLARETVSITTSEGAIGVKLVTRPGGERTAKAEIEVLRSGAGGHAARAGRRSDAEAEALRSGRDDRID